MEGDETIEGDELIEVIRPFTSRALWRKRVLVQKHKIMLFRTQVIVYMGGRRLEKLRMERLVRRPEPTYHQPTNRAATPPVRSDKIWRWMRPDCTGHLLLSNTALLQAGRFFHSIFVHSLVSFYDPEQSLDIFKLH